MSIRSILEHWAIRRKPETSVGSDADALMEIWGGTAHEVAANLSWREDAGLLRSPNPGHWGRVHQEIGRRLSPAAPSPSAPSPSARIAVPCFDLDTASPVTFHPGAYRAAGFSPTRPGIMG